MIYHFASLIVTVTKHTFEKLDTQDAENQQEQQHDKQDVQQCRNRLNERVDHCFDTFIFTYYSEWS